MKNVGGGIMPNSIPHKKLYISIELFLFLAERVRTVESKTLKGINFEL